MDYRTLLRFSVLMWPSVHVADPQRIAAAFPVTHYNGCTTVCQSVHSCKIVFKAVMLPQGQCAVRFTAKSPVGRLPGERVPSLVAEKHAKDPLLEAQTESGHVYRLPSTLAVLKRRFGQ